MQEMKTEYDQKIKDMTKNLGAMVQSGAAAGDGDGGGGGGGGKVQFLPPPEPEVTLKKLEAVAAKLEKQFNDIIKDEIKPKLSRVSDSIKELEKADEKLQENIENNKEESDKAHEKLLQKLARTDKKVDGMDGQLIEVKEQIDDINDRFEENMVGGGGGGGGGGKGKVSATSLPALPAMPSMPTLPQTTLPPAVGAATPAPVKKQLQTVEDNIAPNRNIIVPARA